MKIEWNESRGRASFWLGDAECIADEDENGSFYWAVRGLEGDRHASLDDAKAALERSLSEAFAAYVAPFVERARAEGAAAERAACAQIALDRATQFGRLALDAARDGALSVESAIRARGAEDSKP